MAELDGVPKFAKNADAINVLQAKYTTLLLQTNTRPALIYRLDLAEFAESSTLAKMPTKTNFHRLQKKLFIKWNALPLCTLA